MPTCEPVPQSCRRSSNASRRSGFTATVTSVSGRSAFTVVRRPRIRATSSGQRGTHASRPATHRVGEKMSTFSLGRAAAAVRASRRGRAGSGTRRARAGCSRTWRSDIERSRNGRHRPRSGAPGRGRRLGVGGGLGAQRRCVESFDPLELARGSTGRVCRRKPGFDWTSFATSWAIRAAPSATRGGDTAR